MSNRTTDAPPTAPRFTNLPWLGPREVIEEHGWPMLDLAGTPSVDYPEHIVEAASRALTHPPYPGTRGLRELRGAIADELLHDTGVAYDPDLEILVTVGSMQALHLATQVCIPEGRTAVAHAPSFFYADLAAMAGVECRWAGGADGPPDWEAVAGGIDDSTAAMFVNTPCNPTGYVFRESDIEALAKAVSDRPAWIISDEAYRGYEHDGLPHVSPATHPDLRSRTLVTRSFSKTFAMGPWRVGFIAGDQRAIASMAKLLQYSIIAVDAVAQFAALAALEGPREWIRDLVADLRDVRNEVIDALRATGFLWADLPEAGSTAWANIVSGHDEDTMSRHLGRRYGIPAVQGRLFGSSTPHVRIPFGGHSTARATLLERLREAEPPSEETP